MIFKHQHLSMLLNVHTGHKHVRFRRFQNERIINAAFGLDIINLHANKDFFLRLPTQMVNKVIFKILTFINAFVN